VAGASRRFALHCLIALLWGTALAGAAPSAVTPREHQRGGDQTFLTFPEWYLVYSPAEYAQYVRERAPTGFPFLGHICQFWQGYRAVHDATKSDYPFNAEYHTMIMVIGVSTTVDVGLPDSIERTLVGKARRVIDRRPK